MRRAKAARDYIEKLVQQAEQRAMEVIQKKAENMIKIRNLTDQKMILQKKIIEMKAKIKDTRDDMQISDDPVSSDMSQGSQETDLVTIESIRSLIQQIQEFPQVNSAFFSEAIYYFLYHSGLMSTVCRECQERGRADAHRTSGKGRKAPGT